MAVPAASSFVFCDLRDCSNWTIALDFIPYVGWVGRKNICRDGQL